MFYRKLHTSIQKSLTKLAYTNVSNSGARRFMSRKTNTNMTKHFSVLNPKASLSNVCAVPTLVVKPENDPNLYGITQPSGLNVAGRKDKPIIHYYKKDEPGLDHIIMPDHLVNKPLNTCQPQEKYKILDPSWVKEFHKKKVNWGFNQLGELTFLRTYSRIKENGKNENWAETIERVVNGVYRMQRERIRTNGTIWNEDVAIKSSREMFERIFEMKFLPPGRGLWAMGSPITEERNLYMATNNCAFVSTQDMASDPAYPFTFLMDVSMLGVGCGFDTRGASTIVVKGPNHKLAKQYFVIPDSREGWVYALKLLLDSHFKGLAPIEFNYSKIRKEGTPICGFGGSASGAWPLKVLFEDVAKVLSSDKQLGKPVSITSIVDIQNMIGRCVVAGNVRRTAEIAISNETEEYLDLKNYKINPHRADYGWTSNNSVFAKVGQNFKEIAKRIQNNGEPGLIFMENARHYGRINNTPLDIEMYDRDQPVLGQNPCAEIALQHAEICNLVETFPHKHTDLKDFLRTLKFAYLYGKTVSLGQTHIPETNAVVGQNRRIGLSMSGIQQFQHYRGVNEFQKWCDKGYETVQMYDRIYSSWFQIPRSVKTTSIKPSGTVSLLAGATPGIHFPEANYYIRRIRVANKSSLLEPLRKAGFPIEPAADAPNDTVVVEWPACSDPNLRTTNDVSIWEQMQHGAKAQRHWADNQVSQTITFNVKTESDQIEHVLDQYQHQIKAVSFLPKVEKGAYKQMPYETITKEEYEKRYKAIKWPVDFGMTNEVSEPERFCNNETCEAPKK